MKRMLCLILACAMLLGGCSLTSERLIKPVTFYYLQADYSYGTNTSVIVSEQKEASGHREDLSYLMALYLMGPTDKEHKMPLPAGTRIFNLTAEKDTIQMELSAHASALSDSEFSLACTCLTMTCLGLTDAASVKIINESRSITLSRESLTLFDDSAANAATEETQ